MEIDQAFIAAILTVIGYSINDTVVVFDRLREFLPLHRKRPVREVLNLALNDTLSRTMNTGIASILVLIIMFFFGGATIRGFLFALIIGIIVGTYSSIFIATSLVYDTTRKKGLKM
jgi:SecD/SecF fusion protein